MPVRLNAVDPSHANDVELGSIALPEFWATDDQSDRVPNVQVRGAEFVDDRGTTAASAHVVAQRRLNRRRKNLLGLVGQDDLALVEILDEIQGTPRIEDGRLLDRVDDPDVRSPGSR